MSETSVEINEKQGVFDGCIVILIEAQIIWPPNILLSMRV